MPASYPVVSSMVAVRLPSDLAPPVKSPASRVSTAEAEPPGRVTLCVSADDERKVRSWVSSTSTSSASAATGSLVTVNDTSSSR